MKRLCLLLCICVYNLLCGCASLQSMLETKPDVEISSVKLQDLSVDKVNLLFGLNITNPYSLPLPLTNLQYTLASGGQQFLSGKADVQGTIPAQSSKAIQFPVEVTFVKLLNVLSGVKPGAIVPYESSMELAVDAPGLGPIALPLRQNGEVPVPTVPEVELQKINWDELSMSKATANLHLRVVNRNEFPVDLSTFAYSLKLGDTTVAEDKIEESTSFAKGGENNLQIPISISPINLGLSVFSMLTGKSTGYNIAGAMDVKTPFGPISLPFTRNGNTQLER